jgi:methanethiol S-methyltransferase
LTFAIVSWAEQEVQQAIRESAMIKTSKPLSVTMLVLTLGLGLGSVLLFAGMPLGALAVASPRWALTTVLLWDAALSMLFFLQHSGMIRRPFRAWLARFVDPKYRAAVYGIASGIALAAVVLLWQPSHTPLFALTGLPRLMSQALTLAAFGFFVWGARAQRPFDPLGLAPLVAHLRDKPDKAPTFVVSGPYRWVRHPLYLAVLVLIWSCPDMTMDRLLFLSMWSAWIVLGTLLEETDLVAELGDTYRAYRREVPMLIPWPRRHKATSSQDTTSGSSSWAGARGQGYVVVQIVLIALVLLGPQSWPALPEWSATVARIALPAGIALLVLGVGLIVSGIVALGRNLAAVPRPKQGATLVQRGPYRIVRHPMYTGAILIAFGWALAVAGTLSLVYACMVVGFLAVKTAREERWLREELTGYAEYERRVRRLIPFVY